MYADKSVYMLVFIRFSYLNKKYLLTNMDYHKYFLCSYCRIIFPKHFMY
ncbi:hypothetical protein EUBDOL_01063 [Amedibacillus dolichus DSM 3991]|uniref:Uncharacterized protein n=1 Tax=Amedibacillus dolichus DSM 3991 TaxID=428127 RepID=A8RBE2_9FIRM|nr:hypothetical protein EUBDOL_01063 [Amedibacillus dolichus DSM 3991]